MKVAWLCPYPWTRLGTPPVRHRRGHPHPATWLVNLSNALVAHIHGIQLDIVVETPWIASSYVVVKDNITFHVIRSPSFLPFLLRGWPKWLPFDVLSKYAWNRIKLKAAVRAVAPDLVHAHGTESAYALAALDCGLPWILTLQGIMSYLCEVKKPRWAYRIQAASERKVIARGRHFIAKTPFAERFLRQRNPGAQIFRIENAMPPSFFQAAARYDGFKKVMFVGSFVPEKGTEELFEALSTLRGTRLEIIGVTCTGYAAELSARYPSVQVTWRGRLDSSEIAELMTGVDALVLPSHMENSPNVVSEAMCAGLPVIATRVGGIPDMIEDGRTGLLVEPRNAKSLADAIRRVVYDAALRERLGRTAREEARRRFAPEIAAQKTFAAYEECIRDWGKITPRSSGSS